MPRIRPLRRDIDCVRGRADRSARAGLRGGRRRRSAVDGWDVRVGLQVDYREYNLCAVFLRLGAVTKKENTINPSCGEDY